jgi:hypothetical protein
VPTAKRSARFADGNPWKGLQRAITTAPVMKANSANAIPEARWNQLQISLRLSAKRSRFRNSQLFHVLFCVSVCVFA